MIRFIFCLSLGLLVLVSAVATAGEHPNVVIILADDLGWGDLSFNGNETWRTPHVDSLAKEGAHFERFFVQPVCAPTRAELLTGRYHPRGGVRSVSLGGERLDLDEATIAEAFRAAGYGTGCFGKWHNGSQYPYHPNGRGFDEFYGFACGHWGDYFSPPLDHNGEPVRGEGFLPDDLTTHAVEFMRVRRQAGQPFFCYVAYNTPHSPFQAPDEYWNKFADAEVKQRKATADDKELQRTRAVAAMCENLDANVGRLLATLEELQIADDTIVLFFSDNGPNGSRWNGGMKGIKSQTDEGGVRSPLFVRWPGKLQGGTKIYRIAGAIDLYPTLAGLAGVKITATKPLDGVDLSTAMLAAKSTPPERVLFQHWSRKTSARDQRYRLDAEGRLYDMVADPRQRQDVAAEHPDVAKRLRRAVKAWRRDVLSEMQPPDERPYPVGYAAQPLAILPAYDGESSGGIERSGQAPNCSYFTNWQTADDRMTWEVEVAAAGRYEAIVEYTCAEQNVGAAIELAAGETTWSGTIHAAHDPPARGAEQDRVPRGGESLMKDFRALSLGVQELRAGRARLSLRAVKVPGDAVGEVQAVRLVLQP